jgi:hypothetical protein
MKMLTEYRINTLNNWRINLPQDWGDVRVRDSGMMLLML